MAENTPLDPAEQELEHGLRSLTPAAPSEQELWYRAGRKAGRKQLWLWRSAVAATVLLAAALLIGRGKPPTVSVDRIVYVAQPAVTAAADDLTGGKPISPQFLILREDLEEKGLDALPLTFGIGADDQPPIRAWSPALSIETQPRRG